jgi:hypothetical protein
MTTQTELERLKAAWDVAWDAEAVANAAWAAARAAATAAWAAWDAAKAKEAS